MTLANRAWLWAGDRIECNGGPIEKECGVRCADSPPARSRKEGEVRRMVSSEAAAVSAGAALEAPDVSEVSAVADRAWRAGAVDDELIALYPDAACSLDHDGPFQLLIATVLSAQTTDARVNTVTPELFERYPDPAALGAARRGCPR